VLLDPLGDGGELRARLAVQVLRVLLLPRLGLGGERRLERKGLERDRTDVVLLRDAHDLVLDEIVLLQLSLEVLERRVLAHEGIVRRLLVVLPQVVVLGHGVHVLVDLSLHALERAREQQYHAHYVLVLRDDVEDVLAAGVVVVVLPQADLLRAAEHGSNYRVDCRLDLAELRVHLGALGGHLDAHLEERLVDEEEGRERARRDAALERLEREARAVLQRLVRGRR
jgi:hypothetical protein